MSEPKDPPSFFRKVVKFVANPATDWNNIGTAKPETSRESDHARSELKAMIERRRRNDFVRKREFDMLRKVRREGLTSEQIAALGDVSNLDDSEVRSADSQIRPEGGVKAKIDAIEQQMVGNSTPQASFRSGLGMHDAPTQPAPLPSPPAAPSPASVWPAAPRTTPSSLPPSQPGALSAPAAVPPPVVMPPLPALPTLPAAWQATAPFDRTLPLPPGALPIDTSEVVYDPELDEAVIAFANADFEQCEQVLVALIAPGGPRARHGETWLTLFDLYRAIGRQQKFEALAVEFAQRLGRSAPQWYSLPKQVADATAADADARPAPRVARPDERIGWAAPALLDADGAVNLASQTLQLPLPWVLDWTALARLDEGGALRLAELFRLWAAQPLDMRWIAGERFLDVLQEATPTGARDVDPALWQLRLEALRLLNRADRFDEAAIDYCITYEVSPPSWAPARCRVRLDAADDAARSTRPPVLLSEVTTGFLESLPFGDGAPPVHTGSVVLSGQLVGDIGATLKALERQLAGSGVITVSCARLIRVDFIAAGDLLNWVLARRNEQRSVVLEDAHRLIALFFCAMGINEHARVRLKSL